MCITSCLLLLKAFSFLDSDSFSTRTFFNEQQKSWGEKKKPQSTSVKQKINGPPEWDGVGVLEGVLSRSLTSCGELEFFCWGTSIGDGATANTSGPSRACNSNPFGIPVLCVKDIVHGTKCVARTHRSSFRSRPGNDHRVKKEEVASAAHLSSWRRFHYFTIKREKRRNHVDR